MKIRAPFQTMVMSNNHRGNEPAPLVKIRAPFQTMVMSNNHRGNEPRSYYQGLGLLSEYIMTLLFCTEFFYINANVNMYTFQNIGGK